MDALLQKQAVNFLSPAPLDRTPCRYCIHFIPQTRSNSHSRCEVVIGAVHSVDVCDKHQEERRGVRLG